MSIKRVLVTGASGFIAKHFLRHLGSHQDKPRLIGVGRSKSAEQHCDVFYQVDIGDSVKLREILDTEEPDLILHAAAVTPPCKEEDLWSVNVGGTNSLLQAIARSSSNRSKIIIVGSAAEYRSSPTGCLSESDEVGGETMYGQSKWAQIALAKEIAKLFSLRLVVARPFNLVGPELPERWVVASLVNQFKSMNKTAIKVGNTNSERDFLDVRDCAKALWTIALKGKDGEDYNVCTGIPTKISRVIEILQEETNHRHTIEIDKARLRNIDLDRVYGDNSKIHSELGWEPAITLKQSLSDMMVSGQ
jgi:GDP-4-dehydro-6-deoxy-D-mannose reductase